MYFRKKHSCILGRTRYPGTAWAPKAGRLCCSEPPSTRPWGKDDGSWTNSLKSLYHWKRVKRLDKVFSYPSPPQHLYPFCTITLNLVPQTVFSCRGSYGVGKGALNHKPLRRWRWRHILLVIYMVWWHLPSKTHSEINKKKGVLHFCWKVAHFLHPRPGYLIPDTCMSSPPCIRYQVSRYPGIQISRYPVKNP